MITVYRAVRAPYGLEDMIFDRMEIRESDLILHLPEGLIRNEEPYQTVSGTLTLRKIIPESCFVQLLSPFGMLGDFTGQKIELTDFLERFSWRDFEISRQCFGRNCMILRGTFARFNDSDLFVEAMIEISHQGDIIYDTEELQ